VKRQGAVKVLNGGVELGRSVMIMLC
jgi:hypothetical protein